MSLSLPGPFLSSPYGLAASQANVPHPSACGDGKITFPASEAHDGFIALGGPHLTTGILFTLRSGWLEPMSHPPQSRNATTFRIGRLLERLSVMVRNTRDRRMRSKWQNSHESRGEETIWF